MYGLFPQDNITVDNYEELITAVSGAVRGAATSEQEQTTDNLATVADIFARSAALVSNNTIIREEVSSFLLCLRFKYQRVCSYNYSPHPPPFLFPPVQTVQELVRILEGLQQWNVEVLETNSSK